MKEEDRQPQKFSPEEKRRQLEMLLQDIPRKEKQPDTENNVSLPYPTDAAPEGFAEEVLSSKNFTFDTPDTESSSSKNRLTNITEPELEKLETESKISVTRLNTPDIEVDVMEEPLHISAEALFKCQCKTKELLTSQQAHWLRSEIEKLESEKQTYPTYDESMSDIQNTEIGGLMAGHNTSLTTIITRYKEELKVLEKGV